YGNARPRRARDDSRDPLARAAARTAGHRDDLPRPQRSGRGRNHGLHFQTGQRAGDGEGAGAVHAGAGVGQLVYADARYAVSCSSVPPQPCSMLGMPSRNTLRSSSVALIGDQRTVIRVLPPISSNAMVESITSGQSGAKGCRVMPPSGSENEFTKTRREGSSISRESQRPQNS